MKASGNSSIDKQILFALERISEAFKVLLLEQGKETGLSPIQIQILIFIASQRPERCRVSYLAEEFSLTKATISDSVKVLIQKQLLVKYPDPVDTRSFSLSLSDAGKEITTRVSSFNGVIKNLLGNIAADDKNTFYSILTQLIQGLNQKGVISIKRNCVSCRFYSSEDGQHYCSLIKSQLRTEELRADCGEHEIR